MQYYFDLLLRSVSVLARLFRAFRNTAITTAQHRSSRRHANARHWSFVIALSLMVNVTIFGCLWFYHRYDFHYAAAKDALELIENKIFVNEVVSLDGKRYVGCTFQNSTLEYNGTCPVMMQGNHFSGTLFVTSKNQGINSAMFLLRGLGIIKVPIFDTDTGQPVRNANPPITAPPSPVESGN